MKKILLKCILVSSPTSGRQCSVLRTEALLESLTGETTILFSPSLTQQCTSHRKTVYCVSCSMFHLKFIRGGCLDPHQLVQQVLQKGSQRSKETLHNDLAHALKLLGRSFQVIARIMLMLMMAIQID